MFWCLRELAATHFPKNKEVRYSVISGFIFLRFFAPAILGPRLFDITTEQIVRLSLKKETILVISSEIEIYYYYLFQDFQTNRTLTLISKTIQSLGNLVSCRGGAGSVCKEEYMECVYRYIRNKYIS